MKLWLLRPIDPESGPWKPWFDKTFGWVIRAPDEAAARRMATEEATANYSGEVWPEGGEANAEAWIDPALSRCTELTADGAAGVVLQDFRRA